MVFNLFRAYFFHLFFIHFQYSVFLIKPASEGKKKEEHLCSSLREKLERLSASCSRMGNIPAHAGKTKEEHLCSSSAETFTLSHGPALPHSVFPQSYSVSYRQFNSFRCCQTTTISKARISETLNAVTALLSCSLLPVRFSETCKLSDKFQICKEG